jgi:hypothetical protein
MFYSLFLIAFGVFLGQEYHMLPSVKVVFNNVIEFLKDPSRDHDVVNNVSDSDSDTTLFNGDGPADSQSTSRGRSLACNFQ